MSQADCGDPTAHLRVGTINGSPLQGQEGSFHEEPIDFAPQATHTLTLEYDVPSAAARGVDGNSATGCRSTQKGW